MAMTIANNNDININDANRDNVNNMVMLIEILILISQSKEERWVSGCQLGVGKSVVIVVNIRIL